MPVLSFILGMLLSWPIATSWQKPIVSQQSFDEFWLSYWLDVQKVGPLTHSRYRLMLAEIPASLSSRPRILDVGCGSGRFLELLLAKYPKADVHGIEISREALQAARPDLRARIRQGDILDRGSEMAQASFDLVVCSEVLEHVTDPAAVLREIRALMRPGGTLLLTVPAGMAHWSVQDDAAGHLRRFEFAEFSRLLAEVDLRVERQYSWGGPVGSLYNRLIAHVGPQRAANSAGSAPVKLFAWAMRIALRLDDLFKSERRFQLVARATRPLEQ